MSLDNKFDKIIRDKIDEAEFPFDQSNWEKASRMIDAERAAAAGGKSSKMFLLLGSLFLITASVFFFGISMNNTESAKTLAVNEKPQQVSLASEDAKVLTDVNSREQQESAVTAETKGGASAASEVRSKAERPSNNENPAHASSFEEHSASANPEHTAASHSDPVSGDNSSAGNVSSNAGAGHPASGEKQTALTSNASKRSGNMRQTRPVLGAGDARSRSKNKPEKRTAEEILNASAASEEDNTAENMLMTSNLLQIWNKEEALKATAYDFIRIYDEDYFVKKKRRSHYMNAEAGMAYHFGWKTSQGRDAAGINWFAGVNYGRYISKKSTSSISAGLQLYNISNIHKPFYSQSSYRYDFGSNGSFTEVTASELYYVSVPLRISIPVSRTGKAGMGVNTGLLFNGAGTVKTYSLRDGVRSNETETKTKGYYEGVNPVQVMFTAFYNHRISRRLSVNGELLVGLTDVYNNNISNAAYAERNSGLRVSLQYNIFDK